MDPIVCATIAKIALNTPPGMVKFRVQGSMPRVRELPNISTDKQKPTGVQP